MQNSTTLYWNNKTVTNGTIKQILTLTQVHTVYNGMKTLRSSIDFGRQETIILHTLGDHQIREYKQKPENVFVDVFSEAQR